MRRIALISEHASPLASAGNVDSGGQNIYVAQIARHLGRLGYAVDIFTRKDKALLPAEVEMAPNVTVIHVPAGPAVQIAKERLLPYMAEFGEFVASVVGARPGEYLALHANFFMSGQAALQVRQRHAIPLVTTFHALGKIRRMYQGDADGFPDERFAIEERLVRESDCVIAECAQDRHDLLSLYDAAAERIETIPCGFDLAEFSPLPRQAARRALGWPPHDFVLLQLGRLVPRKGIDNVVRALARMRQRDGLPARLYIVGGNSVRPSTTATPEIGRLRDIAASEGVANHVTFVGRRERAALRQYYCAADVFVTTPWYEPFGITPVEAMACAVPVIGSAVGGIRSTVVDGRTGFLVPPNDPDALAERALRLASQPSLAEKMGMAGWRRAQSHFTWADVACRLAAVYERLSGAAGRPPVLPKRAVA
ncbi:glycosyltransferase family 4 protein [Cupriavidus malaysiensis]|uniref:Glycosyl transferase family 1 n=1 Tax=Cupriavidus malaysiensis TaxID=367825 RepID=A0ABM6FFB5_9BURK|nr:glycosyltransferase family 1 protein [Cupriavidus malaysiensis]AOZ10605.1 glycosyl transferase family 1 [Cupriavidus malaysiensis]